MKRRLFSASLIFLALIVYAGDVAQSEWQKLDYAQSELWYAGDEKPVQELDVFYILPTCVWNWKDETDKMHFHANPFDEKQRAAMQSSYELAEDIFAEKANFYAPYYRQLTLEQWMEGDELLELRFPNALQDVQNAFNYFVKNLNNERPFVLAGFSQGGKMVVELLKTMPKEVYERMLAAYVIGYRVTSHELEEYENIKPATGANDIGVTVCYNSVESSESICPVLSPSALCINPINWQTDASIALMNDTVKVHVDVQHKVLIVDGLASQQYYVPDLGNLFKQGNYHLQELLFYETHLRENVQVRFDNYANLSQ